MVRYLILAAALLLTGCPPAEPVLPEMAEVPPAPAPVGEPELEVHNGVTRICIQPPWKNSHAQFEYFYSAQPDMHAKWYTVGGFAVPNNGNCDHGQRLTHAWESLIAQRTGVDVIIKFNMERQ